MSRLRRRETIDFQEIGVELEIKPDDILIDGGANVGDVTSRLARTGATVYAFEPNPMCYKITRGRFALMRNVEVLNKGLMDREATLELKTPREHAQFDKFATSVSSSFVNPFENFENTDDSSFETHHVACEDLCSWIEKLGSPVRLLKLDIEGAEVAIINKLIDTGLIDKVSFAVVETHERFSDELAAQTEALRSRLAREGLNEKIRLDWG
ncbi:MAG: FkbM family methyltransferase [Pseudomonadota bacterium]